MSLDDARTFLTHSKEIARPIDEPGSPWQTLKSSAESGMKKLAGESAYRARIGARVEPYGVYWIELLPGGRKTAPLVSNLPELGKTKIDKVPPTAVEADYLFPALRGRDIGRWTFQQKLWVFLFNRSTKREDLVLETTLKKECPKTYEFFLQFRDVLLNRANYWKFFAREVESSAQLESKPGKEYVRRVSANRNGFVYEVATAPFYSTFNIGPYTFAPYRVCWSRMSGTIRAYVISDIDTELGIKQLIPTDTATIVPFEKSIEAHYFCALVNSRPFQEFVSSFSSAGRGFGSAAILQRVKLPRFDTKDTVHAGLARLSEKCHKDAATGRDLSEAEAEIEALVQRVWS
jgi:hypothetical protein